jgi:hypothetical protein
MAADPFRGRPPAWHSSSVSDASNDASMPEPDGPARSRSATLLAFGVFALAIALTHGRVWIAGADRVVPTGRIATVPPRVLGSGKPDFALYTYNVIAPMADLHRTDARFEAWLVGRNAETLIHRPWRLFHAEHCAPLERTLTLGNPMIGMGILGIPAQLAVHDPILTYNVAIAAIALLGCFAMYAFVTTLTGVPSAGIVAGLLFGLHPLRLLWIVHPAEWDATWIVLMMLFGYRLFVFGRWFDAIGLAAAGAMQMAETFYQLASGIFLSIPLAVWLLCRFGVTRQRLAQLVFVGVALVAAAGTIYGPYLATRAASDTLLRRSYFYYVSWADYLPSGRTFPGWFLLGLALVGILANRRRVLVRPQWDPRWAIAAGGMLVAIMAAGSYNGELLYLVWKTPPFEIPDPYAWVAGILPGFDTIRVVFRLSAGVILALCILAGCGSAALVKFSGRWSPAVAAVLLAVAMVTTVRPDALGAPQSRDWELHPVRPEPSTLDFFERLAVRGNNGALLELPFLADLEENTERILMTGYHHRRTSACFGSFLPTEVQLVGKLAERLPEPAAARQLWALGFTTVIVHANRADGPELMTRMRQGGWSPLLEDGGLAAFPLALASEQTALPPDEAAPEKVRDVVD